MKFGAVIVAGGMGKRLGKPIPKAFVPINNKELFLYSLEVFDNHKETSVITLVVPESAVESTKEKIAKNNIQTKVNVIAGGKERWNSVENGVKATEDVDVVAIHDAARPFITEDIIDDLYTKVKNISGIITANPVVDTVREFDGNTCGKTVDRSKLIAVGTPQVFKRDVLLDCFEKATSLETIPTDEAMLLEAFGIPVEFSYGNPLNFKVTTPSDITIAEAILQQKS